VEFGRQCQSNYILPSVPMEQKVPPHTTHTHSKLIEGQTYKNKYLADYVHYILDLSYKIFQMFEL
jgi:hypothetical protein